MTMMRHGIAALLLAAAAPAMAALSTPEARMAATIDAGAEGDVALLKRMVEINSGTRNLEGVRAMGALMEDELKALGFETRWVPMEAVTGRAGHVLATHKGNGRGQHILLIGHLDTVFEKDNAFQAFRRDGDTVSGPGVDDMKGGLVIMLAALKAMKVAGTLNAADIRIVLSGDEEAAGKPAEKARADMIEAGKWADAAFEFEGLAQKGGQDIGSIARRGSISWVLETTGKSGHSSGVFGAGAGFGANYELVRIIDSFRRELREPNLTYNVGLLLGGGPVTTSKDTISGTAAGKGNIIAERAVANGDIRALSNEQAERTKDKMRAIVAQSLPGTSAKIEFSEGYPAMPPTEGSRALLGKLNGVNRDLALPEMGELDPMERGAGDIAYVAPFVDGLVGTGAGGSGAHSDRETADLRTFPRQAKRAAILMTRLSLTKRR